MKLKHLPLIIFSLFSLILLALPVLAATPTSTPSATPTTATDSPDSIKKSLQDRIKKVIEDQLQSDASPTSSYSQPRLKAFVGTVASISGDTLTILTNTGHKQAQVTADSDIVNNGAPAKFDSININEAVISIGYTSDNQAQISSRLILYTPPTTQYTTYTFSTKLTSTKGTTLNLDSLPSPLENPIKVSSKAKILSSSLETLKLTDLDTQPVIAVIVYNQKDKTSTLTRLIVKSDSSASLTSDPATISAKTTPKCGDKICQETINCQGENCPAPESPETCPQDCTKP